MVFEMKKLFIACAAMLIGAVITLAPLRVSLAQEKGLFFYGGQLEELEYRFGDEDEEVLAWHGNAFFGTDELKLRWISEGEYDNQGGDFEGLENQLVLHKPISTFFDIKGGVRLDTPKDADRWYAVIGIMGLAPQWIEVDADLFVSERGDVSARLEAEYELLLTNYLILTPSMEINVAFSGDEETGVGSGFNDIELGVRLGYDLIDRSFSPYLGFLYERKFGETADFAKSDGEDDEAWFAVIGAKLMF